MWDGELALITSQEEAYFKLNRPPHLDSDIDLSSRGVMLAPSHMSLASCLAAQSPVVSLNNKRGSEKASFATQM